MSRTFQIHLKQSSVNKINVSVVSQVSNGKIMSVSLTLIARPISLFKAQETILTIILILFVKRGLNMQYINKRAKKPHAGCR